MPIPPVLAHVLVLVVVVLAGVAAGLAGRPVCGHVGHLIHQVTTHGPSIVVLAGLVVLARLAWIAGIAIKAGIAGLVDDSTIAIP